VCDNTRNIEKESPHHHHERRMRIEAYQQGFLKTIKFPSWHNRATRRHGRIEPE
jgi:hypothetical protein